MAGFVWQDVVRFGGMVATIALSVGMLMNQLQTVTALVQEQKTDLKVASVAIQALQIDSAKRSAEYILLDRRMLQIEARLNISR